MMEGDEYCKYVSRTAPKTGELKTLLAAFCVGGIICMIGQGFTDLYAYLLPDAEESMIGALTSMTMIFIGAAFTGFGIYDKIGSVAGAGSIIPITGFANSIASPAMEFRKEGIIFGLMAKMFVIAGPVIVTGVVSSVIVGAIYRIIAVV